MSTFVATLCDFSMYEENVYDSFIGVHGWIDRDAPSGLGVMFQLRGAPRHPIVTLRTAAVIGMPVECIVAAARWKKASALAVAPLSKCSLETQLG